MMSAEAHATATRRRDSGKGSPGREQKVGEALEMLETGVARVLDGEDFKRYLRFAARFHNYSANNCVLILVQSPGATAVAGYRKWQEMGRQVLKGEKGIRILAPVVRTREDRETGEKVRALAGFKTATVFDLAQTDGEPLPEPPRPEDLSGQGDPGGVAGRVYEGLSRLCRAEGVAVESRDLPDGYRGIYHRGEARITLSRALSGANRAKTLTHEVAHHLMHRIADATTAKAARETEAEGVAYAVLSYFGFDASRYSFPYIAGYAEQPEVLKAALARIQKAAHRLIEAVEGDEEGGRS